MSTIPQFTLGVQKLSFNSFRFTWPVAGVVGRQQVTSLRLEIREVGKLWTQAIVKQPITARWSLRFVDRSNLPLIKSYQARLVITTAAVPSSRFSTVVNFNTFTPPSQPSNISAVRNSVGEITVNWNCLSNGGSAPLTFYVDYSINGGSTWYSEVVSESQATPAGPQFPNTPIRYFKQFNFSAENRNNAFVFRVTAQNSAGMTSAPSANTNPIYLEPIVGSSMLFDKLSFDGIPSPWRERLIFAAEEWEKFVKIDPVYADILSRQINYKGIKLKGSVSFINRPFNPADPDTFVLAGCRPDLYFKINPNNTSQNKFIIDDFFLEINSGRTEVSDDSWKQILVHELGHALGIGVMWQPDQLAADGKISDLYPLGAPWYAIPTRSWSSNNIIRYPNMEEEYNQLKGTSNIRFIPLMWDPQEDEFQRIAHWSYQNNPHNEITRSWLSAPEDIMSYGFKIGVPQRITSLSVGSLLDFGYVLANSVIEANQNVILTYDTITGYTYANSLPITYGGKNMPIRGDIWTVVGADIIGGVNKLVLRHPTGLLFTWNMTANWEYSSYETNSQGEPLYIGPNTPEYFAKEITFQTDFNKNGIIGA